MVAVESVGSQTIPESMQVLDDARITPEKEVKDTLEVKEETSVFSIKNALIIGACILALTVAVTFTSIFFPKSKVDENLRAKLDHLKRENSPEPEEVEVKPKPKDHVERKRP